MFELIKRFILSTVIITPKPRAYSLPHIFGLVTGIGIGYFVAHKLKNINNKNCDRLLFGIGTFLMLTEIYKQLYFTIIIGGGNYVWDVFPFQICSIPMYLCLIMPFIKSNKLRQLLYDYMFIYGIFGGGITYLFPQSIFTQHLTITIHSVLWHVLLIFIALLLMCSGRVSFKKGAFTKALKMWMVLALIAFIINCIVTACTNQPISMFFIGPQITDIFILGDIGKRYGWIISTICGLFGINLGAYLCYLPFYITHKNKKGNTKQVN